MNLDDLGTFAAIDTQNMLAQIDELPNQLEKAWQLGQTLALPEWSGIERVVIAGMGGSAMGADLLATYGEPGCQVPVVVRRDYGLPKWARGPQTLVICNSHSGNTEETLSSLKHAAAVGCRVLAISTGGKLAEAAREAQAAVWIFEHKGQPRAAVAYSFGLLLAAFCRLGLMPDQSSEVQSAVAAMRAQQERIGAQSPVVRNPAKRMGGQLMGRWVVIFGADGLAPVARRWKTQINELAKAWAQFEFLPEADHNTLAGILQPEELFGRSMALFLRAASYHPRNMLRSEITRKTFMLEGLNTDFIQAEGDTPLAQIWTALQFGDYAAYYLAMAYGIDPTPVDAIEGLKQEMVR